MASANTGVQRRLVQLQVLDPHPGGIEGPDHVGHLRGPLRQADAHAAVVVGSGVADADQGGPGLLLVARGDVELERGGTDGGLELVGAALLDDAAVIDDGDAAGQLVGLLEVLGRQQHGHAVLLVQAPDLLPEGDATHRVQAGGRLVEEEDGGLVHEQRARSRLRMPPE